MKVVSWNINGILSGYRKGLLDWLRENEPDFLCLQEIKNDCKQLPWDLTYLHGYTFYSHPAEKKGYSGVAIYSRKRALREKRKIGLDRFDCEGRFLLLEYEKFFLITVYLPHGGREKQDLGYKLEVYRCLQQFLAGLEKPIILTGDFNVAHREIDLARPRQNKNNTMFTSQERKEIDQLFLMGLIDSFRLLHKKGGHYSWFPYSDVLRKNNVGWRLDYIFISRFLKSKLKAAFIHPGPFISDHLPVEAELEFS